MAFRLEVLVGNPYVLLGSAISIGASQDFVIRIKYKGPTSASGVGRPIGDSSTQTNNIFRIRDSSPLLLFQGSGSSRINAAPPAAYSSDRAAGAYGIFEFTRTSGNVVANYNNVTFDTATINDSFTFDQFFRHGGSTGVVGEGIEFASFEVAGVLVAYYDPSATNGTGTTLEDTAGTNHGTLTNFTGTTNSWWVSYGSSALALTPLSINSSSISINPVIQYAAIVNLLPVTINSSSIALNPALQYSASINITPNSINSSSISLNPVISYTSALIILPQTINSASASINPAIEYKGVINLTPNTINSLSVSINPFISTGQTQIIGNVTAGFADDLYSVKYKLSGITVNFKG
jgi:hypothetical protein